MLSGVTFSVRLFMSSFVGACQEPHTGWGGEKFCHNGKWQNCLCGWHWMRRRFEFVRKRAGPASRCDDTVCSGHERYLNKMYDDCGRVLYSHDTLGIGSSDLWKSHDCT